jgi:hypothetical protein
MWWIMKRCACEMLARSWSRPRASHDRSVTSRQNCSGGESDRTCHDPGVPCTDGCRQFSGSHAPPELPLESLTELRAGEQHYNRCMIVFCATVPLSCRAIPVAHRGPLPIEYEAHTRHLRLHARQLLPARAVDGEAAEPSTASYVRK